MSRTFVSEEQIKIARQANIAQYLISKGVELVKVGRRYRSKEHDSLVFTDNAYYWNSRQDHGNAIDFLVKHMNMDFTEAVTELTNFRNIPFKAVEKEFKIKDITLNPNMQRAIAYLNKSRLIDYDVIKDLIKNKLLFQSKDKGNIVFPIKDEKGEIVGAEFNGTLTNLRYKGIAAGTKYGYGFNLRTCEIFNIRNYMFFESAIDMLSYINIQHIKGSLNNYSNTLFTSMGGLKINIIKNTLEAFKSNFEPNIYLCVDNDTAAKNFCEKVCNDLEGFKINSMVTSAYPKQDIYFPVVPEYGKDWNDNLKFLKKNPVKERLNSISNKRDKNTSTQSLIKANILER